MTPRPYLRVAHVVAIVVFAAVSSASGVANAKHVSISGTHSKSEIQSACKNVGGINVEGQGGAGYGCFNQNKNTMVACDNAGKCDGFVPG